MTYPAKDHGQNLFSTGPRNCKGFRRYSEPSFIYMDKSADAPVVAARELLEGWFVNLPFDAKADIRGRFREKTERQHQGAFWELYMHEFLLRLGFSVTCHPSLLNKPTRPDFLDKRGGQRSAYVEARLAGLPSDEGEKKAAIKNEVYDLINGIRSPNFYLLVDADGVPKKSPKTGKMRRDLQQWLQTLDPDWPSSRFMDDSSASRFEWPSDGWTVTFNAIPKPPGLRGNPDARPIGGKSSGARYIDTPGELLGALEPKAMWYGVTDLPLIIAINHVGWHCDRDDVLEALYGRKKYVFDSHGSTVSQVDAYHEANGFWRGSSGPRNQHVAGVLVGYGVNVWSSGAYSLDLYCNPWSTQKLFPSEWRVSHSYLDMQTGELVWIEGERAGRILEVPNPWPLEWKVKT